MIEICSERQSNPDINFPFNKQFAKEWCTIKLGCSRRSGHDYAAARIIEDNFSMVFYVSGSRAMSEIARRECIDHDVAYRVVFAGINNINNAGFIGLQFDAVIVNSASSIKPEKLDEIYERTIPMLANRTKKYWILLG